MQRFKHIIHRRPNSDKRSNYIVNNNYIDSVDSIENPTDHPTVDKPNLRLVEGGRSDTTVRHTTSTTYSPSEKAEEGREAAIRLAKTQPRYVIDDMTAKRCLEWAQGQERMVVDIETFGRVKKEGLLYLSATVRLISLFSGGETWFIDCRYTPDDATREILEALAASDTKKIFHNAPFDVPRLHRRFGVRLDRGVEDVLIASKVARAGEWEMKGSVAKTLSHKLEDVIGRELSIAIKKDRELKWGGVITEEHLLYAEDDVRHLFDCLRALEGVIAERDLTGRYRAVSDRLPDFLDASIRGVPLDAPALQQILDTLDKEASDLLARLGELAPVHPDGETWVWRNRNHPEALSKTGKKIGRNGARRALALLGVEVDNTEAQTLLDHREDHPIVGILYNYYQKATTLSRYRKWMPEFYDSETGRLHSQPKVPGAVTGRILYSDPNMQGVDKKKTKEFRKVIKAPAGRSIVTGDFAQQELRIAAYFSEDKNMMGVFAEGRDIYLEVAKQIVGHAVDKEHLARAMAKRATLGFLYGLGIAKYRANVYKDTEGEEDLDRERANRDREAFRAAFPEFYEWQKRYGAKREWFTSSVLGWRRYCKPTTDRDGSQVPKYTERLNGPIQSTAGDILYLTMSKMAEDPAAPPETHFLLSVHDELVLECPEETAREAALWLGAHMRAAIEEVLGVALGGSKAVEVGYGPSWGETTEVKLKE